MENQVIEDLCELTGNKKSELLFRYLGMPITLKILSAIDCEMLLDKMVAKVKM